MGCRALARGEAASGVPRGRERGVRAAQAAARRLRRVAGALDG
jgi:hypothetical protein